MSCKVCGSSAELEGRFVAYRMFQRVEGRLGGPVTKTTTIYRNLTPFSYNACLECTQSKLQKEIRIFSRFIKILSCIALPAIGYGVWGQYTYPFIPGGPIAPQRSYAAAALSVGIFMAAFCLWAVAQRASSRMYIKNLTTDRDQASKALFRVDGNAVWKYAATLNSEFKTTRKFHFDHPNYFVITEQKWKEADSQLRAVGIR